METLGSAQGPTEQELDLVRREAMAFAGIGLYRYSFDGVMLFMDSGALHIFGLDQRLRYPEDVVGQNIGDLIVYVGPKGLMRKEIREQQRIHAREWSFKTLSGDERWVVEDSYLVRDRQTQQESIQVVVRDITERRLAQETLRESTEQYRRFLDSMADPMHIVDTDLRIVLLNRALRNLAERIAVDPNAIGRNVFEVFPFLPEHVRDEYQRVITTGEILTSVDRLHINGREFITETHKIPILERGKVIEILTIVHDMTERVRAEQALRESEEKYRAILDNIQEGYYEVDLRGNFTFSNRAMHTILGYPEAEMMGLNYRAYYRDEVRERAVGIFSEVYRTGNPIQLYDWEVIRKDGTPVVLSASISLLRDSQGTPIGFSGIARDVTQHNRAEQALRESEERYRDLFENANDIVYTHDLTGRFTSLNKAGERISGYTREEAMSMNAIEAMAPECQEVAREMVQRKLRGEPTTQYELELMAKDGRRVPIEVSTRTMYRNGAPTGVQGIARDITERRRAEQERQQLEAQIQHAQKLEGLGILAGGIAHDFNNLLVGIMGYAGLALTRIPQDSSAYGFIQQIESSAQRAAELTNQMLAYSGRGAFIIRPLNLFRLVEEVGRLLSASISKNAMLRLHCEPDLPMMVGDSAQLHQVIMNLITNASDALGENAGVISLSVTTVTADHVYLAKSYLDDSLPAGRYVCLEVSDTGCGMDKETLARIFDPFFSTKFTGRGLGLAAVLGIVRGHKGAIRVYSEPGQGTTFKVLFPVKADEAASAAARAKDRVELAEWTGEATVLLVDDEETARSVAREVLTDRGFTVLLASNGREAVETFAAYGDEISAVILDLTMPVMDGKAAFEKIKELRPNARVILSSGYTEQDVTTRFTGRSPDAFIQKPYTVRELLGKLRDVLGE